MSFDYGQRDKNFINILILRREIVKNQSVIKLKEWSINRVDLKMATSGENKKKLFLEKLNLSGINNRREVLVFINFIPKEEKKEKVYLSDEK